MYHPPSGRERERLAARLAAGEVLEEPAAAAKVVVLVPAAEVNVALEHESYSVSKAAEPRLARRKRRLEATTRAVEVEGEDGEAAVDPAAIMGDPAAAGVTAAATGGVTELKGRIDTHTIKSFQVRRIRRRAER